MRLTRPSRTRLQRALARAPIWLYRLGLGGLRADLSRARFLGLEVGQAADAQLTLARPAGPVLLRFDGGRSPPTPAATPHRGRADARDRSGGRRSEAAYRRVGSDRDHGIPLVALSPW